VNGFAINMKLIQKYIKYTCFFVNLGFIELIILTHKFEALPALPKGQPIFDE